MKMFTPKELAEKILPYDSFDIFNKECGITLPQKGSETYALAVDMGEKYLDYTIPVLPLSQYIRFTDDGNRNGYETPYFDRRRALISLMSAELCEGEGRFISKIMDILFAICEESTWVVPAHNYSVKCHTEPVIAKMPEPVGDKIWAIDLFSAETGAHVALALYLFKEKFEEKIPRLFCDRLRYELNRRIVRPYLDTYDLWWMGYNRPSVNNWNPWINLNVMTVAVFSAEDTRTRHALAEKCAESINFYANSLPADGGCDEGPNYWGVAGACLAEFAELCFYATGGKYNVFDNKLLFDAVDYIRKANIADDYYFNCADSHAKTRPDHALIRRIAKKLGNENLYCFANSHMKEGAKKLFERGASHHLPCTALFSMCDAEYDTDAPGYKALRCEVFESMEVACLRECDDPQKGFYLGTKGGHNAENHNHLDVGNYIVYCDGKPVVIDAGVGTYTKFTFSLDTRYNMFAFRTEDHNLPLINGHGQWIEREHHAEDFTVKRAENTVSMQLKEAYSNKDEIESFTRTASLSDGKITVCDSIKLLSPGSAEFFVTVLNKPEKLGKNTFRIAEDAVIRFSDGFDVTAHPIVFEDAAFARDWETDRIYKFSIKSAENLKTIELVAEISHG